MPQGAAVGAIEGIEGSAGVAGGTRMPCCPSEALATELLGCTSVRHGRALPGGPGSARAGVTLGSSPAEQLRIPGIVPQPGQRWGSSPPLLRSLLSGNSTRAASSSFGLAPPRCRRPGAEMVELPFLPFCALLGALGVVCVAFVSAWCQQWRGGFAWDGSAQMFNWHPVLMVTGMVVLYGAVALVYRLPLSWSGPKLPWKVLHSALALVAFGLTVLGLVAVFNFHNARGTPNMYSLHSWLGLATVLLFSCQWLAVFPSFLLPWPPAWLRALYKPVHVFFGSTILMLAMASCVSGINEKLFFSLAVGPGQARLEAPGAGLGGHSPAPAQR
nr:PREDICTED: cytochrome b ascorbate-dependent protein 3 isoform X2 [Struthio camelus australis]